MTPDEMMKVLELTGDVKKNKGTILGKLNGKAVCLPYQTRMNKNIAVYGASGSMKSRAFARNMIFQCVARGQEGNNASGESLIITDPKSELYESIFLLPWSTAIRTFFIIKSSLLFSLYFSCTQSFRTKQLFFKKISCLQHFATDRCFASYIIIFNIYL